MSNKAIAFTHVAVRMKDHSERYTPRRAHRLVRSVLPYFKAYLKCSNIGLVYVYVDTGLQLTLEHFNISPGKDDTAAPQNGAPFIDTASPLAYSIGELEFEQVTRNCLKLAVEEAVQELKEEPEKGFSQIDAPRFQFVGLPHLISLIHSLYLENPELLQDLAGPDKNFTYDSPKFVEAVIRLRRSGEHPILRFDADVEVNDAGVDALLQKIRYARRSKLFHYSFFSGGYGEYEKPEDPVNDFAVRLHWLVDREAYNQALVKEEPAQRTASLTSHGRAFLRDLGEIGATQVPSDEPPSQMMVREIESLEGSRGSNRKVQQVISGAGLYMSKTAIEELPPFMCFSTLTTWVDDHLKRRLHEVLKHIDPDDLEHVDNALFRQDRNPDGITEAQVTSVASGGEWAYLARLLRGCVLHSLIVRPGNRPGPLASAIATVMPPRAGTIDEGSLRAEFEDSAKEAGNRVLDLWANAEYENRLLAEWAVRTKRELDPLLKKLIDDSLAYVRLVSRWQLYTAAIRKLSPAQAYWLLRRVDVS